MLKIKTVSLKQIHAEKYIVNISIRPVTN